MADELCGVCGASWICEHLDTRRITGYLENEFGLPIAKVASDHPAGSPTAAAVYLRRIATALEEGSLPGDAVLVIVSDEDVHRPFWEGYHEWPRLWRAAHAVDEEKARRSGYGCSPEENAERRRKLQEHHDTQVRLAQEATPFVCACSDRFKTERGHTAHQRSWQRRYNMGSKHTLAP